jgi:hypothetical protein
MKKIVFMTAFALVALAVAPQQSFALSCIDAEGMIEFYVENAEYQVVRATPTEQKEFVKIEADESDPNMMFPEGYTGQLLSVEESYRGAVPDKTWAYFERNGTWNYLCVGAPAEIGSEQIYVLHKDSGMFAVTTVAGVYEVDSEIAKKLSSELEAVEDENMEESAVFETTPAFWMEQLKGELIEMAFWVKLKLAEWNFWKGM